MWKYALLLLLCGPFGAAAQNAPARFDLRGRVLDSLSGEPLPRAVVSVAGARDTLHTITDRTGAFAFRSLAAAQSYRLSIRYIGYGTHEQLLRIEDRHLDLGKMLLAQRKEAIESVVVRERPPVMTQVGDTIQYNTAAVDVLEGSEAIALIHHMPGLEVTDDGHVTSQGKIIDETRVDDRLIFGKDPRDALNNLAAQDVAKIQVYEVREFGRRDTHKVMNLVTRSKLDWNLTVNALASSGADTERGSADGRRNRYGIGSEANFFSEMHILKTDLLFNNVCRGSNRLDNLLQRQYATGYLRENHADLSYAYKSPAAYYAHFGYRYDDRYTSTRTTEHRRYFATDERAERRYADTTTQGITQRTHTFKAGFGKENERIQYGIWGNFAFVDDRQNTRNRTEMTDAVEGLLQSADRRNLDKRRTPSVQLGGSLQLNHKNGGVTDFGIEATMDRSDGSGYLLDTLGASTAPVCLEFDRDARTRRLGFSFLEQQQLTENLEAICTYKLESRRESDRSPAYDRLRNRLDSTYSHDYTFDYLTQKGGLSFINYGAVSFSASLDYQYAVQHRDEAIGAVGTSRRHYAALLPMATLAHRGRRASFQLVYKTEASLPAVEMTREQLDTRNPLLLQAGNPRLKQAYLHTIDLISHFSAPKRALTLDLHAVASFHENAIVNRQQILARDTLFAADGGYRAAAGSILNSYANADGGMNVHLSLNLTKRFRKSGLRLAFIPTYTYTRMPEYVGTELRHTVSNLYFVTMSLRGNIAKKFDYYFRFIPRYNESGSGRAYRCDYLEYVCGAELKWHFLARCYFNLRYDFSQRRYFGSPLPEQVESSLNAALGIHLDKQKRLSCNISGFDLLNRARSRSTVLRADYLVETRRNVPGRYVLCTIAYKLNTSGKR